MSTKPLTVEELDGISIVSLEGDLDAEFAGQLHNMIDKLVDKRRTNIVIDMANVGFVSLSMISSLIGCIGQLRQYGGTAKLCAVSRPVRQCFDILGVGRYIDMFEERMGAVRSFSDADRRWDERESVRWFNEDIKCLTNKILMAS